jgi:preprotein translocase subunit YajC
MYSFYLLQAPAQPGFGGFQFIFLGLMILVFWLFFIRPQAQRAKSQKTFIDNLNKVNEDGTTLSVETSPGSYLKIEKSAISMDWTTALNKPAATDKK